MWARIAPENVIELVSQSEKDKEAIQQMFKTGHLHLCCKAITERRGKKVLYLTTSAINWKRPRGEG